MTDPQHPNAPLSSDDRSSYRIMRKGSRYNILGPHGREFGKYKSSSVVGPRWEELTHTPWPYPSSAYMAGQRLWELGLIERAQIGARKIAVGPQPDTAAEGTNVPATDWSQVKPLVTPVPTLALPAPSLDLAAHERGMTALRRDPVLIFTPQARQVLRDEVLYHRPNARWAQHVLNLLARYERQQRRKRPAPVDARTVTRKHVAWQEQQFSASALASLSC